MLRKFTHQTSIVCIISALKPLAAPYWMCARGTRTPTPVMMCRDQIRTHTHINPSHRVMCYQSIRTTLFPACACDGLALLLRMVDTLRPNAPFTRQPLVMYCYVRLLIDETLYDQHFDAERATARGATFGLVPAPPKPILVLQTAPGTVQAAAQESVASTAKEI